MLNSVQLDELRLEERLAQLEAARDWSPRVVSKLEMLIRSGDDFALFRINPLKYAAEKNMREGEAIDLFLYATKFGLFEMDWHLVCPFCAHVVESFKELGSVHSHFVCNLCSAEHDVRLDDYISVTFTISPQIRELIFHHPESRPERLTVEDFYLKYHISQDVLPLPNGLSYFDAMLAFTKALQYIPPRGGASVEFALGPGMLYAVDLHNNTNVNFNVHPDAHGSAQSLPLHLRNRRFYVGDATLPPGDVRWGREIFKFGQVGELESGSVQAEVANDSERVCALWLIHFPAAFTPQHQQFAPFLSSKRLLSTQTFLSL
ncbi:MAG: DUF5939 domain-containing protein, partial [Chloroflexi bacterium]|nr:DUF5939 domain-containing protein [Chloroflexota bacterium]